MIDVTNLLGQNTKKHNGEKANFAGK